MQSYADFVAEFFEGGPEGLQEQDRLLGKLYVFLEKRGYAPVSARDLRVLVYKGSTEEWIESYLFRLYAEGYIGLEWYETATGEKRFKVECFSEPKPTTLKRVANHLSAEQAAVLIEEVQRRVYESKNRVATSIKNWLSNFPESQRLPRLHDSHRASLAEFCDESDPASFYDVDHPDELAKRIQEATFIPGQCFIPSTYSDAFASELPGEPTEGWIVSALKERFQLRLTLDCLKEKIEELESNGRAAVPAERSLRPQTSKPRRTYGKSQEAKFNALTYLEARVGDGVEKAIRKNLEPNEITIMKSAFEATITRYNMNERTLRSYLPKERKNEIFREKCREFERLKSMLSGN